MASYPIGQVAGLKLTVSPSAIVGALVLWAVLGAIAIGILKLSPVEAIIGGLIAVILHFVSELVHQFGHAYAARRTGYPMIGVRFWLIFGASIYPKDEGDLPASVHIRRALGGPPASFLLTLASGVIVLALQSAGGLVWWLAVFLFVDNLFVFTLGPFLPLGFTDGSTLLYWWGKR